jgi:hypothetical protein
VTNSFYDFLEMCKGELNHHQSNVKDSFEKGWKPLFDYYRMHKSLPVRPRTQSIALHGIDLHGLSDEEAFFITSYTGSFSSWLNVDIRSGQNFSNKCKQCFARRLSAALDKLPPYAGKQVFRMDSPLGTTKQVIRWFQTNIGQVIHVPYFLSAAKVNYGNTPITWHIQTSAPLTHARDISSITNNMTEQEVLFRAGSYFQILEVESKSGLIDMVEVGPTPLAVKVTGFYFE